jgi:hypothetical protein
MKITKANGESVEFRPAKIRETLKRIGAKPETIEHVIVNVTKGITEGMTTREVFAVVRRELRKEDRCLSHRYNLRKGLLKLGPAGFKFEKYVAAILQAYEYKTEIPKDELIGLCVRHEVDVVATSTSRVIMIEAKFRNRFDDTVTLKDAMATWARLIDLREGAKAGKKTPKFDEAWIVTNGRFSDRAHQFGVCKGMQLIGWSTEESSLARMVDHAALYPITVIDDLRQWELDGLEKKGYVLCREIAGKKPEALARQTGIAADRAAKIVADCKEIVNI